MSSQSKFDKVIARKNKDTPWAENWPEPEFDHQAWEEVLGELSDMADEIIHNTPKH